MSKLYDRRIEWPIVFLVPIVLLLTILGSRIGGFQKSEKSSLTGKAIAETTVPVTREVLAQGQPGLKPCRVLELVRYPIHPGANLPPHTHPGMQVGKILSGELIYFVVEGESEITRSDGSVTLLKSGVSS